MNKKYVFGNPVMSSPWVSVAPKTMKHKKKSEKGSIRDENLFRTFDEFNRQLFTYNFPYHKLGFYAHTGRYYSFYKAAKCSLLEARLKQYPPAPPAHCNYQTRPPMVPNQPNFKLQKSAPQRGQPIEVIDITEDSINTKVPGETSNVRGETKDVNRPVATAINIGNVAKIGRAVGRKQKSPKMYVKIAPKSTEQDFPKKSGKEAAVGVVITRNKTGYVVRLL